MREWHDISGNALRLNRNRKTLPAQRFAYEIAPDRPAETNHRTGWRCSQWRHA